MPHDPHPEQAPELDPLRARLSSSLYPAVIIALAVLGAWAHSRGWL